MISEGVPTGHADVGLLNDYLSVLPEVDFLPQFLRYAFSTYGERDPGVSQVGSEGHFGPHRRDGAG